MSRSIFGANGDFGFANLALKLSDTTSQPAHDVYEFGLIVLMLLRTNYGQGKLANIGTVEQWGRRALTGRSRA